jgi:hypothetical protein
MTSDSINGPGIGFAFSSGDSIFRGVAPKLLPTRARGAKAITRKNIHAKTVSTND